MGSFPDARSVAIFNRRLKMQLRNLICGLTLALTCLPLSLLAQTPSLKENAQPLGTNAQTATGSNPDAGLVSIKDGLDARVTIIGTVTDLNGDAVIGASVTFDGPSISDRRTVVTDDSGFFKLSTLNPATPYHLAVKAEGFTDWSSPDVIRLNPGQVLDVTDVKLQIAPVVTSVSVVTSALTTEEIAGEQLKLEEKQRVLGIIPNFYVVYDHNAVALTTKMKYTLVLRTARDPFTIMSTAALAGMDQAADTPNYVQGARGYAERFGAVYADGFTDLLIGGAVLPSLLHQDPRYFYQGTGTTKSRTFHALSSPFICKGDNGHWQPNLSSVGGDLATGAISNLYYPPSNRGLGLVFGNALIITGGRVLDSLVQEFVLRRFTPSAQ
jgi:hypothetical protein